MHFLENVKLYNRYSQYAEDSLIEAIFNKIGTANKWCVECGASDGLFFSNTRKLIEEGWSSIQIEADFEQYKKLSDRYLNWANGMTVFCEYAHLGAAPQQTFDGVFAKYQTLPKDFDLLVIDVDGQDYHLWNQLLTYHPRVVICEYDPNADQDFIPEIDGPGQAGMRAIHHVALARGYQVVCATQCNLICVRNDLMELLTREVFELSPVETDPRYSPEMDRAENIAALESMRPPLGVFAPESPRCQHGLLHSVIRQLKFNGAISNCSCCGNLYGHLTPREQKPLCQGCRPAEAAKTGNGHYPIAELPFTEQQLIDAKAQRAKDKTYLFAGCMSTPRWGPLSTMEIIQNGLASLGISLLRGEGAYWHHILTDSIERALLMRVDAVITFDYDSLFCPTMNASDIARLCALLIDNPDVDIIVPMQMRREGGPLLATVTQEVNINQALIPIEQGHFGMTIIRASVFDRLDQLKPKPWFWERANDKGSWGEGRIDADIGWWLSCKEVGIKVCLSTDVVIGHGEYGPTWPGEDMKAFRQPLNGWRDSGMKKPPEAFDREKFVQAAIEGRAKMEVKLDMGE